MKKLVFLALVGMSQSAWAIQCPTQKLECQLDKMGMDGAPITVSRQAVGFEGVNTDEPSEPANECVMGLALSSGDSIFEVTTKEDLTTYVAIGLKGQYGVLDPQASFVPTAGKEFRLYYKDATLTCVMR